LSSKCSSRLSQARKGLLSVGRLQAAFVVLGIISSGAQAQAQAQQSWEELPMMELQGFYRGPMKDTLIQRWRDTETGAICYIYMPIIAQNTPTEGAPYVHYGPNQIGSISCVPALATPPAASGKK